MELESWILALSFIFERFHKDLSNEKIKEVLGVNLKEINPENSVFHPSDLLNKILQIVGQSYDKKKGEVNRFLGIIEKEDILRILESKKCNSFNLFCESLFGQERVKDNPF